MNGSLSDTFNEPLISSSHTLFCDLFLVCSGYELALYGDWAMRLQSKDRISKSCALEVIPIRKEHPIHKAQRQTTVMVSNPVHFSVYLFLELTGPAVLHGNIMLDGMSKASGGDRMY